MSLYCNDCNTEIVNKNLNGSVIYYCPQCECMKTHLDIHAISTPVVENEPDILIHKPINKSYLVTFLNGRDMERLTIVSDSIPNVMHKLLLDYDLSEITDLHISLWDR